MYGRVLGQYDFRVNGSTLWKWKPNDGQNVLVWLGHKFCNTMFLHRAKLEHDVSVKYIWYSVVDVVLTAVFLTAS